MERGKKKYNSITKGSYNSEISLPGQLTSGIRARFTMSVARRVTKSAGSAAGEKRNSARGGRRAAAGVRWGAKTAEPLRCLIGRTGRPFPVSVAGGFRSVSFTHRGEFHFA